jgi:hypothetical protein
MLPKKDIHKLGGRWGRFIFKNLLSDINPEKMVDLGQLV